MEVTKRRNKKNDRRTIDMNKKIGLYDIDVPPHNEIDWNKYKVVYIIPIFLWDTGLTIKMKKKIVAYLYINIKTFSNNKEAYETGIKKAKELVKGYNSESIKIPVTIKSYRLSGNYYSYKKIKKVNHDSSNKYDVIFSKFEDLNLEDLEVFSISIIQWYKTKKGNKAKKLVCNIKTPLYNFSSEKEAYDLTIKLGKELCDGFNNGTLDPKSQKTYTVPRIKGKI